MQSSKVSILALLVGVATCQTFGQAASPEAQDRAIQLLRHTLSQDQMHPAATSAPQPAAPAQTKTSSTKSTTTSANKKSTTTKTQTAPANPQPAPAPMPAPEQPSGPKTKQQRLADLLELYKADKLSPSEYHAQRAKIIAEP